MEAGIYLIDKPSGMTSHDVVVRIKRALGVRKAGHAGTLDPMATGLLIVGVDTATKILGRFVGLDKEYRATLRLGIATDTQDKDGRMILEKPVPPLKDADLLKVMETFVGPIVLKVPAYSAVKVGGTPLYRLARRGLTVDRPLREVKVHEMVLLKWQPPYLTFTVRCSSGTYVRALGEEMAIKLGTVGHLTSLRRLAIGPYRVENATSVDGLRNQGH